MTKRQFIGAITRPQETIAELLADKGNAVDLKPGIRMTVIFQLVLSVVMAVAAWLILGLLLGLAGILGGKLDFASGGLLGFFGKHLSPVAAFYDFARSLVAALSGTFAAAFLLDLLFQKMFKNAGGQTTKVFNVLVQVTLPFSVFMVVPLIGPLIALVGILCNWYRVIGQAYHEKDSARIAGSMLLSGLGATVATSAVMFVLMGALRPLTSLDPMAAWTSGLGDRAVFGDKVKP